MSHNVFPTPAAIAAESGGGTANFLRADGTWAPAGGGGGDVSGPGSATNDALVRFDGTTGKVVQSSTATLDDDGQMIITNGVSQQLILRYDSTPGNSTALVVDASGNLRYNPIGAFYDKNFGIVYRVAIADEAGNLSFTDSTALGLPAATTTLAPLRIPHGTAPSSPTDGDLWSTTSGFYGRVNGATVGPFGSGGGGGDASFLFGAITDSTNSSNTVYAAVSGSDVTVEAGKTYWIKWLMRTYSAANTTAPRPRRILGGGAAGTVYGFHYTGQSNASAAILQSSREGTNDPFLATGNATSSTTASGSLRCECLFTCTTGGTIGLEFLSEVNASLVTISGDGSFWVATVRNT